MSEGEHMSTADWRWAAEKGYWNPNTRCWNESVGGMKAYLFQRNLRRAARGSRKRVKYSHFDESEPTPSQNSDGACVQHVWASSSINSSGEEDLETTNASPLLNFMAKNGWAYSSIRWHWTFGYCAETIIKLFNDLTVELKKEIGEILKLTDSTNILSLLGQAQHAFLDKMGNDPDWAHDQTFGFIAVDFSPTTQERTTVFVNARVAEIYGMTRQELVNRFACHNVPLALPAMDSVRHLLFSLANPSKSMAPRFFRMVDAHGNARLVSSIKTKRFDPRGRLIQMRQQLREVSPDEYDAAVRLHPAASPLAATGDFRSGRALLAAAAADAAASLGGPSAPTLQEGLLAFARGARARLDRMAKALTAKGGGGESVERPLDGPLFHWDAGEGGSGGSAAPPLEGGVLARLWWAGLVLVRLANMGYQVEEYLVRPRLRAIPALVEVQGIPINIGGAEKLPSNVIASLLSQPPLNAGGADSLPPVHAPGPFDEVVEQQMAEWEANSLMGFARLDVDPARQRRRRIAVTSTAARIFGMHREESMARIARRDLPFKAPEEDCLRLILFEIANCANDNFEAYGRATLPAHAGDPFLYSRRTVRTFDAAGRLSSVRHCVRVVDPDEYDAVVRRSPAASVLAATGDTRSGRRLLAEAAADSRRPMAAMAQTASGRARLAAISASLTKLVALIAAAHRKSPPP